MDALDTLEEFRQALQCGLCNKPYKQPHTLSVCGHTFCHECVISTLEGPGISKSECPVCHKPGWKNDLRFNYSMRNLVENADGFVEHANPRLAGAAAAPRRVQAAAAPVPRGQSTGPDVAPKPSNRRRRGARARRGRSVPEEGQPEQEGQQAAPLQQQQQQQETAAGAAPSGVSREGNAAAAAATAAAVGTEQAGAAAAAADGDLGAAESPAPTTPDVVYDSDWEARMMALPLPTEEELPGIYAEIELLRQAILLCQLMPCRGESARDSGAAQPAARPAQAAAAGTDTFVQQQQQQQGAGEGQQAVGPGVAASGAGDGDDGGGNGSGEVVLIVPDSEVPSVDDCLPHAAAAPAALGAAAEDCQGQQPQGSKRQAVAPQQADPAGDMADDAEDEEEGGRNAGRKRRKGLSGRGVRPQRCATSGAASLSGRPGSCAAPSLQQQPAAACQPAEMVGGIASSDDEDFKVPPTWRGPFRGQPRQQQQQQQHGSAGVQQQQHRPPRNVHEQRQGRLARQFDEAEAAFAPAPREQQLAPPLQRRSEQAPAAMLGQEQQLQRQRQKQQQPQPPAPAQQDPQQLQYGDFVEVLWNEQGPSSCGSADSAPRVHLVPYHGMVIGTRARAGRREHCISYLDGDEAWHTLAEEQWRQLSEAEFREARRQYSPQATAHDEGDQEEAEKEEEEGGSPQRMQRQQSISLPAVALQQQEQQQQQDSLGSGGGGGGAAADAAKAAGSSGAEQAEQAERAKQDGAADPYAFVSNTEAAPDGAAAAGMLRWGHASRHGAAHAERLQQQVGRRPLPVAPPPTFHQPPPPPPPQQQQKQQQQRPVEESQMPSWLLAAPAVAGAPARPAPAGGAASPGQQHFSRKRKAAENTGEGQAQQRGMHAEVGAGICDRQPPAQCAPCTQDAATALFGMLHLGQGAGGTAGMHNSSSGAEPLRLSSKHNSAAAAAPEAAAWPGPAAESGFVSASQLFAGLTPEAAHCREAEEMQAEQQRQQRQAGDASGRPAALQDPGLFGSGSQRQSGRPSAAAPATAPAKRGGGNGGGSATDDPLQLRLPDLFKGATPSQPRWHPDEGSPWQPNCTEPRQEPELLEASVAATQEDEGGTDGAVSAEGASLCVVVSSNNADIQQKVLRLQALLPGLAVEEQVTQRTTHVLVPVNDYGAIKRRSVQFLLGLAHGCWVVSFQWVDACLREGRRAGERNYQAKGRGEDCIHGPALARHRHHSPAAGPGLFAGRRVHVVSDARQPGGGPGGRATPASVLTTILALEGAAVTSRLGPAAAEGSPSPEGGTLLVWAGVAGGGPAYEAAIKQALRRYAGRTLVHAAWVYDSLCQGASLAPTPYVITAGCLVPPAVSAAQRRRPSGASQMDS